MRSMHNAANSFRARRGLASILLAATAGIGFGGCISLTKHCENSFGLNYRYADQAKLAADAPIPYSIGVGKISIDDQYNHTFLTERDANGMLMPHEHNCWLESVNVMAEDVLRDYVLDRMGRPGGVKALADNGYPQYTIEGRLMEISALTSGAVTVRMDVRVIEGDRSGRTPKVVMARVVEVRDGAGGVRFTTGGNYLDIPRAFSSALVELGRSIVRELDGVRAPKASPVKSDSTASATQPLQHAPAMFTLAGSDSLGRIYELRIGVDTAGAGSRRTATLTFVDHNGEQHSLRTHTVRKLRNGLGLAFIDSSSNRPGSVSVLAASGACRVVCGSRPAALPHSMPCDCINAHAFLAWWRALNVDVQNVDVQNADDLSSRRRR